MNTLSPRAKVLALGGSLGALVFAAALSSGSFTSGARVVLGVLALAGLAAWALRRRGLTFPGRFAKAPRLQVVQKIGLSARAGVALVEVDGRSFLIVHGDGDTRVRRVPSRAAVMARSLEETES